MTHLKQTDFIAPHDYTEMHRRWYPFIVNLVNTAGIDTNNKEDVAQDIFLRLMEWDIIGAFNPDLTFERRGMQHRARFKSFLSSVVLTYVRGHRDRQTRLERREILVADSTLPPNWSACVNDNLEPIPRRTTDRQETVTRPETDTADLVIEKIMEEQNSAHIHNLLAKIPRRNGHDTCDLAALFDAVREQVVKLGYYDVQKLKDIFGVGNNTMYSWMWWLKANLAEIYGVPLPPRRPRTVRPKAV